MEVRASRTSSSLKGLIMAMTIFMDSIPAWARFYIRFQCGRDTEPNRQSTLCRHGRTGRINCRASSPWQAYPTDSVEENRWAGTMGKTLQRLAPKDAPRLRQRA